MRTSGPSLTVGLMPRRASSRSYPGHISNASLLENCPSLISRFGFQAKARLDSRDISGDSGGDVLTHHRPMLEPVARTAADQPDVIELWMHIDEEVSVGSVLVLPNTRFSNRRVLQRR